MLVNRDEVLELVRGVREKALDYFIPLGGHDKGTPAKREISNLTGTLYNHLPLVKSIVEAARDLPVYVGYDGQNPETRSGTYTNNLILLHDSADESSLSFIHAYTHELVHLDQDRRGLLRENERPPSPDHLVDYLAHNLMLEAAAFATEAVSLYYISNYSTLNQVDDEVEGYFDDYESALPGNGFLRVAIEDALAGKKVKNFHAMKPAWQAAFQSFFNPDSAHVANYLKQFTQVYLSKCNGTGKDAANIPDNGWGGINELRAITTLPGLGPMFTQSAMPVVLRAVQACILQDRHLQTIDVVRGYAAQTAQREQNVLQFLLNMK